MANMFNEYPYTDFHEMNLDFVLKKISELEKAQSAHYALNVTYVPSDEELRFEMVPDNI